MPSLKYGFSDNPEIDQYLENERGRIKKQFIKDYTAKKVSYSNAGITHFLMDKRAVRGILHDPWQMDCNDDHISYWKDGHGNKIAVSQPYHLDQNMLKAIAARCGVMRLEVSIDGGGWHYPGKTALVVYRKIKGHGLS